MLPLEILIFFVITWAILEFALKGAILENQSLLNLLTFVFSGIGVVFVIAGTSIKEPILDFKLEELDLKEGIELDSLSENELKLYFILNSIISRVILLCGFLGAPLMLSVLLALLSGSLIYCLGGSLITLLLWKKFFPTPADFRREFFVRVDEQLKNSQNSQV